MAAWLGLGVLVLVACAHSESGVEPLENGAGTSSNTAGGGSGGTGGSGGGTAGTFTAVSGSTSVSGTTGGGSGGSGGSAGSAGSAGTLTSAGGADDCAGGAGGDCSDACPDDPDKTEPGICGCGVPDVDTALVAGCTGLKNALVHRYSFDGTGTAIEDLVGTADGTVVGTTLSGNGLLTLGAEQYGELPDGLLSGLTNASFEAWVNWTANNGQMWQRIFDFGVSDMGNGMQGTGDKYLFLAVDNFRFCYRASADTPEVFVDAPISFPSPATAHVVAVFDDATNQMRLYLNAALQDSVSITGSLSAITDLNNWLGRSQFAPDPEFGGNLRELRIYNVALSQAQIQRSYDLGEAPDFLEP
jgi:hypothetical protein